jgi:hypothetical protein
MVYTITVLIGLHLTNSKEHIASRETECFPADEEISSILLNKNAITIFATIHSFFLS